MTQHNTNGDALKAAAVTLAEATEGAYMRDSFSDREWLKACRLLLEAGWTPREAEAILLSKWVRWSCDAHSTERGKAAYILEFVNKQPDVKAEVAELVAGTF